MIFPPFTPRFFLWLPVTGREVCRTGQSILRWQSLNWWRLSPVFRSPGHKFSVARPNRKMWLVSLFLVKESVLVAVSGPPGFLRCISKFWLFLAIRKKWKPLFRNVWKNRGSIAKCTTASIAIYLFQSFVQERTCVFTYLWSQHRIRCPSLSVKHSSLSLHEIYSPRLLQPPGRWTVSCTWVNQLVSCGVRPQGCPFTKGLSAFAVKFQL